MSSSDTQVLIEDEHTDEVPVDMPQAPIIQPSQESSQSQPGYQPQPDYQSQPGYYTQPGSQLQPVYQSQQQNMKAPSEAPPTYRQSTNRIQSPSTVVCSAPRTTGNNRTQRRVASEPVPDYTILGLCVALLCCIPFGLAAYYMAKEANDKVTSGDVEGARFSARCSLGWSIAGILGGIILTAGVCVYYSYLYDV